MHGVVLADDGDRIYLAVATHGEGETADAHSRILAFGKEALGYSSHLLHVGSGVQVSIKDGQTINLAPNPLVKPFSSTRHQGR